MLVLPNVKMKQSILRKKKKKELPNLTKKQSYMMLKLHNIRMELSNVRKKIKEPPNVTKIQSHVMLVLRNMRLIP